ncbi:unnamed protein product [Menidia menidia]|uniref:(Atlantic silverside) hypothetical protein n=1 Tax=Menidia menidia TaxID=238744 RepID=A0A8S4AKI2_9TELE|nr:unnamed protein product [Menidia menidia]
MASTKTKQGMVFLKEVATAHAAAPATDHPLGCFVPRRPEKGSESGTEQITCVSSEESDFFCKHKMYPSKDAIVSTGGLKRPTNLNNHSETLSPDITFKGIKVTLDNNSMWKEFYSRKTEMILTKEGNRMFPYCRFRISCLQPAKKYSLIMDIQPLDHCQYKWTGEKWQVSRKAECHMKSPLFAHPDSPATGQHWMQSPVSFYRLKLTNNISDQDGNIILHPNHRYLPQLYLVQTEKAIEDITLNDSSVLTFSFPQTEFMAVTAYQNPQFAQLKVKYNPFAKGLKEDGCNSWGLKLKPNSSKDLNKDGGSKINDQHPVKKSLKSLLASHKPRCSKAGDSKPTVSKDLQNNLPPNSNQSADKIPAVRSNSGPAQKLFSDLIREAHVSLQRCSVEQLDISHNPSPRVTQTNTKTRHLNEGKGKSVPKKDIINVETPKKKKEDYRPYLNSCTASIETDLALTGSSNSSEPSDNQCSSDAPSDASKQQKRPARLPLPALALFLKKHSLKSKKTDGKLHATPPETPSESLPESRSTVANSDHAFVTEPIIQDCRFAHTDLHQDGMVLNVAEQADDTAQQPSSPLCFGSVTSEDLEAPEAGDPFLKSSGSELTIPDGAPVLPNSEPPFCTIETSASTLTTCTTSNTAPNLPPFVKVVLASPNSTQTSTEASTLPSDSSTLRTEPSLPDPECTSFDFEPLSPASSPEPLPLLPASLALELDTSASEATSEAVEPPEDRLLNKNSSVFKWHTVLPPSESDRDTAFTGLEPAPDAPPLISVTPTLFPCHSEPQSLSTPTAISPDDPPVSFQESEHLLPFPAELSPLALQLTLSPTFSSLDENGLSPTPSLSDFAHFFNTDVETGIGVALSNTDTVTVPCPPPSLAEACEPPQQVLPISPSKPCKRKKCPRWTKSSRLDMDQTMDDYRNMQPNLEEVEEQLFISFTSKEALKSHIADPSEGLSSHTQTRPESQQTPDANENSNSTGRSLEETIAAFQEILLRDLGQMKYRQVIHPVLQEVGLKMTLLDPGLSIDLQYLGVQLPIPPPGVGVQPLAQTLPPSPGNSFGVSSAFVSRTGKTTDVTQIKGWREKFTLSDPPPTHASSGPEAGSGSDSQKKNLSAFCSDMLDEYLENEGKLIDERAASFSQSPFEAPVYQLPMKSTSWTGDHIPKKQTSASDLISGFIPPSKRPQIKEARAFRKTDKKQKTGRKQNKPGPELGVTNTSESSSVLSEQSAQTTEVSSETVQPSLPPIFKKKRKLKPRILTKSLNSSRPMARPSGVLKDLAPLESDSELGHTPVQSEENHRKGGGPVMTRGLLRQKDLEDGVVWQGRARTSITEERAAVALTSLFTLTGFVSDNPTAPIQLARARASPCLNEFCRLGCICSSLSYSSKISHCGRPCCMFGCTCLKQKVVLLKNLDSSDSSSTSHTDHIKNKKGKKRMRMAYVLKESDSVSKPAERVQILWRRNTGGSDPEPVHSPDVTLSLSSNGDRNNHSSCARVRGYRGWVKKREEASKEMRLARRKAARLKFLKQKNQTLGGSKANTPGPNLDKAAQPLSSKHPPDLLEEPTPKPSKRLFILADCKWESDADQSYVLKKLCQAMAQDQLDQPFWIRKYLINPIEQTVEGNGADQCIQYRIRISTPKLEGKNTKNVKLMKPRKQADGEVAQERQRNNLQQAAIKKKPPKNTSKRAALKGSQNKEMEEAEALEDWQKEVEESDIEPEEETCASYQVDDGQKKSPEEMKSLKDKEPTTALPFLTGVSPAGFLSANRKQPGGSDLTIQVNGKLYPLAKIQLGRMGALHPANRLAAYLTGRVGPSRQQEVSSCKPAQTPQTTPSAPSALTSSGAITTNVTATPVTPELPVTSVKLSPSLTDSQSSSSVGQPVDSQVLKIQVQGPHKGLALSHPTPHGPTPPSTNQKIVLQLVPSPSGDHLMQHYRKPDVKLVPFIPFNQLAPIKPSSKRDPPSSLVPSVSGFQKPAISAACGMQPPLITSACSSSSSPLSAPPLPAPLDKRIVVRKRTHNLRVPPAHTITGSVCVSSLSATEVKMAPGIPPLTLTSPTACGTLIPLKPPMNQGAELGVDSATASRGPERMAFHHKPASPQIHPTSSLTVETPSPKRLPPQASTLPSNMLSTDQGLARDAVDLDIICVEEENMHVATETQTNEMSDLMSSSETEDSSDFRESDDEENPPTTKRNLHNMYERNRRVQLQQKFDVLMGEVVQTGERIPKICILRRAVKTIRELSRTERHLKRNSRELRKKRDEYMSMLVPSTEYQANGDVTEVVNLSGKGEKVSRVSSKEKSTAESTWSTKTNDAATASGSTGAGQAPRLQRMRRSSDVKDEIGALSSATNTSNSPKVLLLDQAPHETHTHQRDLESLRMGLPGKGGKTFLDFSSSQEMETHTVGGAVIIPSTIDTKEKKIITSSHAQPGLQTAPSPTVQILPHTQSVPIQVHRNVSLIAPEHRMRPKTVPNILSRSRNPASSSSVNTTSVSEGKALPFKALVPAEVLSFVRKTLPKQQLLSVTPGMLRTKVLQGVAAPDPVTLKVPILTTGRILLAPVPKLSAGNLPATDSTSLLHLVEPAPGQQHTPPLHHQLLPATPPTPAQSDLIRDQLAPQTVRLVSSQSPGPSPDRLSDLQPGEPPGLDPRPDPDGGGLSSLLNEISLLSQQTICMETTTGTQSLPNQTQASKDSEVAGLNGHTDTRQGSGQPGPATDHAKDGGLAPPPLLHMKVGGGKVAGLTSTEGPASGGAGGGRGSGDVAWKPMPRLVPLGLRGNSPS